MAELSAWGIEPGWHDVKGVWHQVSEATAEALAAALGAGTGQPEGTGESTPVWVLRADQAADVGTDWTMVLEDGGMLEGAGHLPPNLPLGYHRLAFADRQVLVIVAPERCHLPDDLRSWLLAVQVYALRSSGSWGIGDLQDLRATARWASERGAGMVMVNPLHAALPGLPQQSSPYSPSSRIWRNPIYIRPECAPGADVLGGRLQPLAEAARRLLAERRIDRDASWLAKSEALEQLYQASSTEPSFVRWRSEAGQALERFAVFCALSERFGRPWQSWPPQYRRPSDPEVAHFASVAADRVAYHAWLQWVVELQLAAANAEAPLLADLAVGADPDGADAWSYPECFAQGARIGAPPDEFNTLGQDWGLVPFDPWKLRTAEFAPYIAAIRANLRHAGGLRVDHVMGFWRQWWVPLGAAATDGAYVRYPAQEMLDILALESVRASAVVVGEDLGTVEAGVREELAERGVLSSKVALFEPQPPRTWPKQALASFSTHDLPTVAGLLDRSDFAAQQRIGLQPDGEANESARRKIVEWAGADQPDVTAANLAGELAASPCALVAVTLEDAFGVPERTNMPGTTDSWPNWSLSLPVPLEEALRSDHLAAVVDRMNRER